VAALVARVVTELDGAERERIETAIPRELPPVDVDPLRIGQVLDNLVTNALKYAPRPSPVRIDVSQPDPGWVEVRVEDEGVGVPEEDRALVLEPFYRARNVRESTIAGTGLGLAISRRIVEAHGGRLWLADRDDGRAGTTAAFTVPVARRALRRRPTPTPTPTPTSTSSRSPATDAER
jgi:signal transduction histidine kinase